MQGESYHYTTLSLYHPLASFKSFLTDFPSLQLFKSPMMKLDSSVEIPCSRCPVLAIACVALYLSYFFHYHSSEELVFAGFFVHCLIMAKTQVTWQRMFTILRGHFQTLVFICCYIFHRDPAHKEMNAQIEKLCISIVWNSSRLMTLNQTELL